MSDRPEIVAALGDKQCKACCFAPGGLIGGCDRVREALAELRYRDLEDLAGDWAIIGDGGVDRKRLVAVLAGWAGWKPPRGSKVNPFAKHQGRLELTDLPYRLFDLLRAHRGSVVNYEAIAAHVWPHCKVAPPGPIRIKNVAGIVRKALGNYENIATVAGVGLRLETRPVHADVRRK